MRSLGATLFLSILLLARAAIAAEQSTPPAAPGRVHDGFYLRLSAGGGLVNLDVNPEPGFDDDSTNGAGVAFDLLVGGSPFRGTALGGALLLDIGPSMTLASGTGKEASSALGIALIGPFVDAFPDPKRGWHFGGVLGLSALSLEAIDSAHHRLLGFGGAIWGGNEFWVGDEWSLGGALRVAHTQTRGDAGSVDLNAFTFSAALMLTAAYH